MTSSCTLVITSRLARDPEMKRVNDSNVTTFTLPVDVGWGDRADTEWVRVSVWGKRAHTCAENLRKGSTVTVTGTLEKTWVSGDKATIQMKAERVNFISGFGKQEEPQDFDDDMPF